MNKQEWESLFERAQGERASKWQWWVAESHVETSEGPVGSNARIVPYVESARNISTLPIFLTLHSCTNWINNYSRECEFIMSQEFPRKQYMCRNMIKPQIINKIIKKLYYIKNVCYWKKFNNLHVPQTEKLFLWVYFDWNGKFKKWKELKIKNIFSFVDWVSNFVK